MADNSYVEASVMEKEPVDGYNKVETFESKFERQEEIEDEVEGKDWSDKPFLKSKSVKVSTTSTQFSQTRVCAGLFSTAFLVGESFKTVNYLLKL